MAKYIRTTKHTLKFSNKQKLEELYSFIKEYKRVANIYLDYIWNNNFSYSYIKDKNKIFTTHFDKNTKLDLPNFISTVKLNKELKLKTTLTARVLKCCIYQVSGIIRGNIEKQRKRQYIVDKLRSQSKKISKRLRKATRHYKPTKPDLSNIKPELNIACVDFKDSNSKEFDVFIQLKCFTNTVRGKTLNFPIKYHRNSNKWRKQGKRLNSFLFSPNSIDIRYEIERNRKSKGVKVGVDQGAKTVITFSNGRSTPKTDKHKHSLESIMRRLERKRKGSKSFEKTQEHRKNFINWSINQLNFSNIKEIGYENVKNLRYKSKFSRYLSHWKYTEIRDKIVRKCEEEEVLFTLQSSIYKSQRCSTCGLVLKSNRNKKVYHCKNCGLEIDADLNASLNHQQDLPDVPENLRKLNLNRLGFFWKSDGFYTLTGEEITVPLSKKIA